MKLPVTFSTSLIQFYIFKREQLILILKNLFITLSISLFYIINLHSQERTVWKEMNKEEGNCGSSLKLYSDNSYFLEEFCDGVKFSFSMGEWKKRKNTVKLKPLSKKSITLEIIKREKTENPFIKVLDINNNPINQFDFLSYPKAFSVDEVVNDMDKYLEGNAKLTLTEISSPLQTDADGKTGSPNISENYDLLAYDFYRITGELFIIKGNELLNNSYVIKINLPKEVFQYQNLDYFELPVKKIILQGESYSFIK